MDRRVVEYNNFLAFFLARHGYVQPPSFDEWLFNMSRSISCLNNVGRVQEDVNYVNNVGRVQENVNCVNNVYTPNNCQSRAPHSAD